MHNLVKFCPLVLKILSGKEILTSIKAHNSVANLQNFTLYNPNLDIINVLICIQNWVHTITKKHYIPESTLIYQKALRKHMQGGVCMPCGLLFYEC